MDKSFCPARAAYTDGRLIQIWVPIFEEAFKNIILSLILRSSLNVGFIVRDLMIYTPDTWWR